MQYNIVSVGDYMTGENVHHFKRGISTKFKNKFRELIDDKVGSILSDGDLLFINFESSLASEKRLSKLPINKAVYVAPLETLTLLKDLNIPVIANVANNHFGQHGPKAASYTIKRLEESGITVIGKNSSPEILAINGIHFKIWGVSLISDKSIYNSYFRSSYNNLIKDLKTGIKDENEVWILSIHWGDEYSTLENNRQRELALQLSEIGFDYILGHHPHTIQPVEQINNTWVVYSHGNFLFDQNFSLLTQKGLITKFSGDNSEPELFITQQKNFRIVNVDKITIENLKKFCMENYSAKASMLMRIKMKAELLTHFYELNIPILKTFGSRLMNWSRNSF
ncbi:MAG TPA: CapA family protein [Lentimicrobium sp.]|nr:CapA family protein [Lentimicrobium sp.]